MQRTTIYITVLVALGLIATAFTVFTPIWGVILLVLLGALAFAWTVAARSRSARKARDFAAQAEHRVEFTEADRETLAESGRRESTGG